MSKRLFCAEYDCDTNFRLPTDVQSEAIPLILGGGDVLMAAETGSGKTGAFCLPVLQVVWETLKDIQAGKSTRKGPTVKHGTIDNLKSAVVSQPGCF